MKTMTQANKPHYYVLDSESPDMMLLFDIPDPSFDDDWYGGRRFETQPQEPIIIRIIPDNEQGDLLPYFGTTCVMSDAFYDALHEAGVDNLEVFEAVIQSKDGTIVHAGYKAFNIVGLVRAADLSKTKFTDDNPSRLIDASIEALEIDPDKAHGLLMFRLAEYVGAVLVHEKVKQVIEAKKFPYIVFREPGDFVS